VTPKDIERAKELDRLFAPAAEMAGSKEIVEMRQLFSGLIAALDSIAKMVGAQHGQDIEEAVSQLCLGRLVNLEDAERARAEKAERTVKEWERDFGTLAKERTQYKELLHKAEADTQAALNFAHGFERERDEALSDLRYIKAMALPEKIEAIRKRATGADARISPASDVLDLRDLLDAVRVLLAELTTARAALEKMTWQPIETAPKDARQILLFPGESGMPTAGLYDGGFGWVDIEEATMIKPMHWMPLPLPPKEPTT
jgi:hypothetical protein